MSTHRIRARRPRGSSNSVAIVTDSAALESRLADAAHHSGGHAAGIAMPRSEADAAAVLRGATRVLPIGAQSSLTGGATPMGDLLVTTEKLNEIFDIDRDRARVQAGVSLAQLHDALASAGRAYPPVPTFMGAFVGGVVSTNAAGAATFKYGSTRDWVEALTVVLASGDVVDIVRGEVHAHADGYFELEDRDGIRRVPIPSYRMPAVAKRSAGYFAAPEMDPIDLFIGSEGTLGIIVEVTLRVLPHTPSTAMALAALVSERQALDVTAALREESLHRRRQVSGGIDVVSIEYLDRRSVEVLREDGSIRKHSVNILADAEVAVLFEMELPAQTTPEHAWEEIAGLVEPFGLLDRTELAMPGSRRGQDFIAIREAVPAGVNQRVATAKHRSNPAIEKTAADMIVPFERLDQMLETYRHGFDSRGLDYAIWGHLSDGNLHPNVIPRSLDDVRAGREAILEFGRTAIRLGGCPLAEHGVGRNPVKQALLRELYGEQGIEEMRRVKRAFDPEWKLSPGVIFPPA